jgi:soluble cytochrome b562
MKCNDEIELALHDCASLLIARRADLSRAQSLVPSTLSAKFAELVDIAEWCLPVDPLEIKRLDRARRLLQEGQSDQVLAIVQLVIDRIGNRFQSVTRT